MDINLTSQTVKNETTVFCITTEAGVEGTAVLDRTKSIKKILKTSGRAAVTSKTVSDRTVTVEGTVTFCVIYIDSNNTFFSHEHTMPFSKTVDADRSLSGTELYADITEEKYSSTLCSDGTVMLNGKLCIKICAIEKSSLDIMCDISGRDIELLCSKAEATVPMGRGEKNLILDEEISVGNGQPSVGSIIRYCATSSVEESKIISGKVMVKGTVRVYVLYMPEEGTRPQSFEDSFVFSQLIDVDGITDECKCDSHADILFFDITPKADETDEIRSFSVAVKIGVFVKAYCDNDLPVVLDAYSTQGNCEFKRESFSFKKITETVSDKFIAKKEIEFTDGAIGSVIDMWCEVRNSVCRTEKEHYKLTGTILINLLAFDCDGEPECYERPVDFEYTYKFDTPCNDPEVVYSLSVPHSSYTIIGANTVSVAVEPQIFATVYDNNRYTLISDVVETQKNEENPRKSCIVLYFAEKGERVWDIARKYNSSVREIKELNSVSEDILIEAKKFIIPTK